MAKCFDHRRPIGVLPVFQTPYTTDQSIDWDTLGLEIEWLLEQGVNGVTMAMVSEVLRMSTEERRRMAEFVCRAVGNRGHVVISVGAESTYTAVELARHAEQKGASAVMAIPPLSVRVPEEQIEQYFTSIIQAVGIPVIVQDASGYVGTPLSIALQARLLSKFGAERVYFKPEAEPIGPRLTDLLEATGGAARVFEGSGGIALVDSYRRGIVGTMPGADLIAAIVALWQALLANDNAAVERIEGPLKKLVALQAGLDGFLAVEKHLLHRQGVFANTITRGPVALTLDNKMRTEVDRLFDQLATVVATIKQAGNCHAGSC